MRGHRTRRRCPAKFDRPAIRPFLVRRLFDEVDSAFRLWNQLFAVGPFHSRFPRKSLVQRPEIGFDRSRVELCLATCQVRSGFPVDTNNTGRVSSQYRVDNLFRERTSVGNRNHTYRYSSEGKTHLLAPA